jgi:hypothetical protein
VKKNSVILASIFTCAAVAQPAPPKERPIPCIVKKDGRFGFFVDGAPYLMLGAQVHNSSTWPAMLPKVWPAMEYLHVNTMEAPIYWEQFEPQRGKFDYTVIDTLLAQAREHKLRLVLLWFGTWKNGSQHYTPEWMKLDTARYPHIVDKNGRAVDSPSPYAAAALEADKAAFTAFMRHLKATDPARTVIMVQMENEAGAWGSLRDYSPTAQKLFEAPVPADVLGAMHAGPSGANWQEAFGAEAEVCFHAWSVAKYVGQVAAAGKAVYPLPMYANAAVRDPLKPGAPGTYESGGPTDNVIPIWKVAAPALDIVAPDIYENDPKVYLKLLELYHRHDNPLFVPETGGDANPRFFFAALGMQAIGFSPFGMDYTTPRNTPEVLAPWALNYRIVGPMAREVARLNFEGKLQAVAEEKGAVTQTLSFGAWNAVVSYGAVWNNRPKGNSEPVGRVLVAQLKDNQFLVAGAHCRVDFQPADAARQRQFLKVEEGVYENGAFKFLRIWNGDETDWGLDFGEDPLVLRVTVATY